MTDRIEDIIRAVTKFINLLLAKSLINGITLDEVVFQNFTCPNMESCTCPCLFSIRIRCLLYPKRLGQCLTTRQVNS